MKKYILLAALAALPLIDGCSRVSLSDLRGAPPGDEVAIHASGLTKSALDGTVLPDGLELLVSAWHNADAFSADGTSSGRFTGLPFTYDGTTGSYIAAEGVQYYPPDGSLDLLAVALHCGTSPIPSWDEANPASMVTLTLPDDPSTFPDILYGAANGCTGSVPAEVSFHHALTTVAFILSADTDYDPYANTGITVDSIYFEKAFTTGTLTILNPGSGGGKGKPYASWDDLTVAEKPLLARVWDPGGGVEVTLNNYELNHSTKRLADLPFGHAYAMMPPQKAVPFIAAYTVHSGFEADGVTPLDKALTRKVTPTGEWEEGKRYVYDLTFSASGITLDASVDDWVTVFEPVDVCDPSAGHPWVDLGLRRDGRRIVFATANVGGGTPSDPGLLFAWGESWTRYLAFFDGKVSGEPFEWANCPFHVGDEYDKDWTAYVPSGAPLYAYQCRPDGLTTLRREDDAAAAIMGGGWRMPDLEDIEYLTGESVYYEWVDDYEGSGKAGLLIKGQGTYSNDRLFLPAAGFCCGDTLRESGEIGIYWTRNIHKHSPFLAHALFIGETMAQAGVNYRYQGLPVRAVLELPER